MFDKYLIPKKERTLSPKNYLREADMLRDNENVESIEFIPPRIGQQGYGKFRVRYKNPILTDK